MAGLVESDLELLRGELASIGGGHSLIERASRKLLDLEGKLLRPLCVLLAARLSSPSGDIVPVAIAVELIHSATLLHDDVVDLGNERRGHATARSIYGNAASIFAGDWLLIDALRRVRSAEVPELLDSVLAVIDEMILAESIQLENRGRLVPDIETYFDIVSGKTASLFGWATAAGAIMAGLPVSRRESFRDYGLNLGIAFQLLDDLLDFTGTASGKDLLADLHEGKSTYPLLWAAAAEPELASVIDERLASSSPLSDADVSLIRAGLDRTGALEATRRIAAHHTGLALAALEHIPRGPAHVALTALATAALHRDL